MPETLSEPVEAEPSEILPEAFLPAVPDEALSPPALDDFLPEAEPSAFSEALPPDYLGAGVSTGFIVGFIAVLRLL